MSETTVEELQKALSTAIGRIAAMESELRSKPAAAPGKAGIDLDEVRQGLLLDPLGFMQKLGFQPHQINHAKTVFVSDFLGDKAPPDMRLAAAQGPQLIATQATNSAVAELSRRLDELSNSGLKAAKRESFKAITASKDKHPNLSKAVTADEDDLMAELDAFKGTAEEFATAKEAKLSKLASVFAPQPASVNNADTKDQSSKVAPAPLAGGLNTVQSVVSDKPAGWTAESHATLRDKIVHKLAQKH